MQTLDELINSAAEKMEREKIERRGADYDEIVEQIAELYPDDVSLDELDVKVANARRSYRLFATKYGPRWRDMA